MSVKTKNPTDLPHLILACFLIGALWQIASMALNKPLLPAPYRVCQTWWQLISQGVLWPHIAASLYRMFGGLFLALVTAVPVGMAAGRSRRWDAWLAPFLYIFYSIPKVVFLPVIIVVLGLGDFPKIFLIAITVFFQIAITVRDAAKAIPEAEVMTMRSLCGTPWQNLRHLIWPACLPGILTALRTSLGIALALLFITETFAAFSGLGYFIMNRMEIRNYEEMYAAILTLAAIGIIAYIALDKAEGKLCPWRHR
ncbi:MAG: ABC transporter permease [Megasphaera sp.]|uniref:ABC transporter permease n=1 Tax=Megasphaera sp. TaxID=2023260 RepID=UPI003521B0D7